MASGLFLDPYALLRTAPLVTSTCTLWYAFDQDMFLDVFLHPGHRRRSNELLPSYFHVFFRRAVIRVLGLLGLTLLGGGCNVLINRQPGVPFPARGHGFLTDHLPCINHQTPLLWYTAGTMMCASHLIFVPSIATKVQAIIDDQSHGQSTRDLERWLAIHRLRTWTVDLAAWVCFAVGVCLSGNDRMYG